MNREAELTETACLRRRTLQTAVCTFSVSLQVEGYEEARAGLQYCPPLITRSSGRANIERVSKYIRDGYKK